MRKQAKRGASQNLIKLYAGDGQAAAVFIISAITEAFAPVMKDFAFEMRLIAGR